MPAYYYFSHWVIIYPVYNIPTEAVGRRMQFVLLVQAECSKTSAFSRLCFREREQCLHNMINCRRPPIPPVPPLFCLTYFCPEAGTYMYILSPYFHSSLCVCLFMFVHTQSCVSSFQTKFSLSFVLSRKAAPHSCACSHSLSFRAELKET